MSLPWIPQIAGVLLHVRKAFAGEPAKRGDGNLDPKLQDENWIDPLLKRLDLVRGGEASHPQDICWRQIEENQLVERVGKLVAAVNLAAGYHVLEMVDYLPPQKNVLRIAFDRQRAKHVLEIMIQDGAIVLVFSTTRHEATGWRRYVSMHSARNSRTLVWEQVIYPAEVLEQNIQAWVSFLLSGLDKKFRLDQILQSPLTTSADINAILRKISA